MTVQRGPRKVLKLLGKSQAPTLISLSWGTQLWGIPCCWDGGVAGWCLYGGLQTLVPMTPGVCKGQSIHVTFIPLVRQRTLSIAEIIVLLEFFFTLVFAFISTMKKKRKLLLVTCVLNLTIKVIQQHFYSVPIIIMIMRDIK